ncbi:MAG: AAA family ATPase [Planctomycetaceae bacterium]
MIFLKSIELTNFKGVSKLACDFDDLTVLAGLNNSGKTTILQGIYLVFAALPRVAEHAHVFHAKAEVRTISLQTALSPLGLRDTTWLMPFFQPEVTGTIIGLFENGISLELGILRNSPHSFVFKLSHSDATVDEARIRQLLASCASTSASILTPPGDVPTRETMVNGDQYQQQLRDGQGAQLWRNGLWWAIQKEGFESFAPVQQQIKRYFPDVELLLPTLGTSGTPEIMIKYNERGKGPLDIAQSGAGLRTFISLARVLEQSPAGLVLLDEPDSHLHASQQAVILNLMMDAASAGNRQVIIASHSPEIISRVPAECIRWVARGVAKAEGGYELIQIMEHLGVSAELYVPKATFPDVLVYVEGVNDKPLVEAIIKWCRIHSFVPLPTTIVVPHRDGRFEGPTLQGIVRFAREIRQEIGVVGVRDLDWYYNELPGSEPNLESGDGWTMITLPCKEMENLFCDAPLLFEAYNGVLPQHDLQLIIDAESKDADLLGEWRYQVRPRIRDRLSNSLDASSRERKADRIFSEWEANAELRRRLVAGKGLLRKIRQRIREQYRQTFFEKRVIENLKTLTSFQQSIAKCIFPEHHLLELGKSG